jgi:hypothetical protein
MCFPSRLTFELNGHQRQDARARTEKMYTVPQAGPWWPAVGAPLERGVRPHLPPQGLPAVHSVTHRDVGSAILSHVVFAQRLIDTQEGHIVGALDWLSKNVEWVFSGVGVAVLAGVLGWLRKKRLGSEDSPTVAVNNHQSVTINAPSISPLAQPVGAARVKQKSAVSVLFIDDDVKFQVVNILKRNGWSNTKIIKDVISLEQPEVASADIFFVDIQGVGVSLGFKDQGLGLVIALRKKYPTKKIVIYSAENANAFHAAFGQANERISKDADPYEFMEAVDRLSE